MNAAILERKGARKLQDIPAEVLDLLNKGQIESVNLTEWLAINHQELLSTNAAALGLEETLITEICQALQAQKKPTAMNSIKLIGAALAEYTTRKNNYIALREQLLSHPSDSIRAYACYLIALQDQLEFEEKMNQSRVLVADSHFGVREVVWMALRPTITQELDKALVFLSAWSKDADENIRRFTSEAIRPRGVWCKHIEPLKEKPEIAVGLLENLKADPAKYVQDSVGNWLNDASKTQAEFVKTLCKRWEQESSEKATAKIIKKALRTIVKEEGK